MGKERILNATHFTEVKVNEDTYFTACDAMTPAAIETRLDEVPAANLLHTLMMNCASFADSQTHH